MVELNYQSPPPTVRTNRLAWLFALAAMPVGFGVTYLALRRVLPTLLLFSFIMGFSIGLAAIRRRFVISLAGVSLLILGLYVGGQVQVYRYSNELEIDTDLSPLAVLVAINSIPTLFGLAIAAKVRKSLTCSSSKTAAESE